MYIINPFAVCLFAILIGGGVDDVILNSFLDYVNWWDMSFDWLQNLMTLLFERDL